MDLTSEQTSKILKARPDVAGHHYYGENVGEWWGKYGVNELGSDFLTGGQQQQSTSLLDQQRTTALQNLQAATKLNYSFDTGKYLPGIKEQAASIYDPQQAQLEAIRQLQSAQYQEEKIKTEEIFEKEMQNTIEAINARGAYFSGGAIEAETDLREQKVRALNMLGLQASAADFQNLAQQGLLGAEEAQFIQDKLYNVESSAYNRWMDQRNFSYQAAVQEYQIYASERDYVRNVFESDRTYNRSVFESDREYELLKEEFEMEKDKFKQQYDIDEFTFEKAKKEWEWDIEENKLSTESALTKFKENYSINNSGIGGVNENGEDIEQKIWEGWQSTYNGLGIFDPDKY